MLNNPFSTRGFRVFFPVMVTLLALTACSSVPVQLVPLDPSASVSASQAESARFSDGWVKAANEGMTAAFGVIENTGSESLTIVAVTSTSATTAELHETAIGSDGVSAMRPITGGITVPPGGEHVFEPGGDHIMLIGLNAPIHPGDEVLLAMAFSDGSTLVLNAIAKDFAGADETYEQSGQSGSH